MSIFSSSCYVILLHLGRKGGSSYVLSENGLGSLKMEKFRVENIFLEVDTNIKRRRKLDSEVLRRPYVRVNATVDDEQHEAA